MAEFWAEFPDAKISSKFDDLDSFYRFSGLNAKFNNDLPTIYAEGVNIELNRVLSKFSLYNYPIIIQNTTFTRLEIELHFQTNLTFTNCVIEELIINGNTKNTSDIELSFITCTITTSDIINCKQIISFNISNESWFRELNLSDSQNIFKIYISDSEIDLFLEIQGSENKSKIHELEIYNSDINAQASITNCEIYSLSIDSVYINKFKIQSTTISGSFNVNVIENTVFEIYDSIITNIALMDFSHISCSQISFIETRAEGNSNLAIKLTTTDNSKFVINQCQYSTEVHFYDDKLFENCIDISINETVFKELVIFGKTQPRKLKIVNSLFQKGVLLPFSEMQDDEIVVINPKKIHSSVWCLLKNQALQRNDKIIALNYRKNEMNSYLEELKQQPNKLQEKVVLFLNQLSNNHGLSWFKGVCFTLLSWVIFFTLYEWSANNFYFSFKFDALLLLDQEYWTEAIGYLWLPHGLGRLTESLNLDRIWLSSISMVFTFILGKIAIAYGIYQTISAFRKHGKI